MPSPFAPQSGARRSSDLTTPSSSALSVTSASHQRVGGALAGASAPPQRRAESPASSGLGSSGPGLRPHASQRSLLRPSTDDGRRSLRRRDSQHLTPAAIMQSSLDARRGSASSAVPSMVRRSAEFAPETNWKVDFGEIASAPSAPAGTPRRLSSTSFHSQSAPHPGKRVSRVFSNSQGIGGPREMGHSADVEARARPTQPAGRPAQRNSLVPAGSRREKWLRAFRRHN